MMYLSFSTLFMCVDHRFTKARGASLTQCTKIACGGNSFFFDECVERETVTGGSDQICVTKHFTMAHDEALLQL